MNNEIVIASNNESKIKEIQDILKKYNIIPMKLLTKDLDVEEDGNSFEENAIKKAKAISKQLNGKTCIADDSGIEIEYLDGFPGVKTKRWFNGTDRERNLAILEKLNNIPKENRKVKFVVAIAVANSENTISTTASIEGYISNEPRGENGFGFDEIFELENGKTLAELSNKEKDRISSRKIALEKIKKELEKIY